MLFVPWYLFHPRYTTGMVSLPVYMFVSSCDINILYSCWNIQILTRIVIALNQEVI